MGLPKSTSHDSLDNLEMSDSEIESRPSDQVDEVGYGSEREGACEEQGGSEDEVVSEDEESESEGKEVESESEGKEVESESEGTEASEVLERPSVFMALGAHDGKRRDAPRSRVPRCRVVDVETCDNILTRE
ncbi:UNVERIFIED_CONTAM: hypothetical protein Slati_0163300 [Sesamum latifolium]|uniref:Uncharacterized protein n=1 Tax=Sesamum latifolium TaxID=2727402 RepID=A0AAW2YBD8_9LAMI